MARAIVGVGREEAFAMKNGVKLIMVALMLGLSLQGAAAQGRPAPTEAVYTPLISGWQQFFRITWEPMQRHGRPYVGGYVLNDYGFPAIRVQLLVDGLDASGRVTSQSVSWLGPPIQPGSRVYFEVPAPQPATTYRVSIFAFDWLQTASIQAP